jgi:hypothetical protein
LLAGRVPCPPFTVEGKQLGAGDERELILRNCSLRECEPAAVTLVGGSCKHGIPDTPHP